MPDWGKHPINAAILSACLWLALARAAAALELGLPIRCTPGVDCWIAHHVDQDPGPGVRDVACGRLAYDGHDGIDFAIADLSAMAEGVEVLAAADGIVLATRDGEPDDPVERRGREAVAGRECGNGVLLDHGQGRQTQYCHLRRGSVRVARGQEVRTGQPLGLVGLSGLSSFPHLHFELRVAGRSIDPFTGAVVGEGTCPGSGPGWWKPEVAAALAYRAVPLTGLGVAMRAPERAELDRGEHRTAALPADAPALVVWARGFGLAKGDRWRLRLLDPSGRPVVDHEAEQDRDQALAIRWAGRRRPEAGWPTGTWRASVEVRRGEQSFARERTLELVPP
ncbi:MAG: M23 family metallopeptidase [Geminicoccaceae bacterium]|nr:M23 family metallopeptidase [Geminicoccaceae bacterium]MCX8100672.1 M23 family metallopeptidase [Geminicoccaceae bacterium]MDW8371517.1 M23 family metallopeptidase [Geminicoccaceae bacterium]